MPATKITGLGAGASQGAMNDLAELFFQQTGNSIHFVYAPVGSIVEKIAAGANADIIVLTDQALAFLTKEGRVRSWPIVEVGKVGVGIAVRAGTTLPDISTPAAFRKTLLAAESIVYADPSKGASSGIHFASVLNKLEIAEEVKKKSFCLSGGYSVMEAVAGGKAKLGIQQMTEIVPVKGITLVGPLPAELQKVTTYMAGIMSANTASDEALRFLHLAGSQAAADMFRKAGFGMY